MKARVYLLNYLLTRRCSHITNAEIRPRVGARAMLIVASLVVASAAMYWIVARGRLQSGQGQSSIVRDDAFADVSMAAQRVQTNSSLAVVETTSSIVAYDNTGSTPVFKGRIADGSRRLLLGVVNNDVISDVLGDPFGPVPTSTDIERVSFGSTPQRVFRVSIPGVGFGEPAVFNDRLYRIVDADPQVTSSEGDAILEVYTITTTGLELDSTTQVFARALAVTEGQVYLLGVDPSTSDWHIQVATIDLGGGATLRGSASLPGEPNVLVASGDNAYLYDGMLRRIDATQPDRPLLVSSEDLDCGSVAEMAIDGNQLVGLVHVESGVAPETSIVFAELTDGALPSSCSNATLAGRHRGIWAADGRVWMVGEGLEAFVAVQQGNQVTLDPAFSPASTRNNLIAARSMPGNRLAAYDMYQGLALYETNSVGITTRVATLALAGGHRRVALAVSQETIYVISEDALNVIDASTFSQPAVVETLPNKCRLAGSTRIDNDHLFVLCQGQGMTIYDISAPLAPTYVGEIGGGEEGGGFDVLDGVLYSTVGERYLRTYDVADPAAPTTLGEVSLPAHYQSVVVVGDDAYLVSYDWNVAVVDVQVPSEPTIVSSGRVQESFRGNVIGAALAGDTLLLATDGGGVAVVQLSGSSRPSMQGFVTDFPELHDLAGSGSAIISGVYGAGAVVWDASDPMVPLVNASVHCSG